MQAQQVPVVLKPKTIRRPDTVNYPAPSPDPTTNCRPDFRSCGHNIYTGFHLHTWDVLDQVAKPNILLLVTEQSKGPMDTVARRG